MTIKRKRWISCNCICTVIFYFDSCGYLLLSHYNLILFLFSLLLVIFHVIIIVVIAVAVSIVSSTSSTTTTIGVIDWREAVSYLLFCDNTICLSIGKTFLKLFVILSSRTIIISFSSSIAL